MTYKLLKLKIIFTKMSIFQLLKYTITTLESLSTINRNNYFKHEFSPRDNNLIKVMPKSPAL